MIDKQRWKITVSNHFKVWMLWHINISIGYYIYIYIHVDRITIIQLDCECDHQMHIIYCNIYYYIINTGVRESFMEPVLYIMIIICYRAPAHTLGNREIASCFTYYHCYYHVSIITIYCIMLWVPTLFIIYNTCGQLPLVGVYNILPKNRIHDTCSQIDGFYKYVVWRILLKSIPNVFE